MDILAFAGSLREKSLNKALLRAIEASAPEALRIEVFDLQGIPLFDTDVEAEGDPDRVERFKEAIRSADAVLMACPEYNHGISGVLKNAVDWGSRPPRDAPLAGKPVGIVGATPGMGGTARAQDQLRQSLKSVGAHCMPKPEVLVPRAHQKFDEEGILTDSGTRDHLERFLAAFVQWVQRFDGAAGPR
ncbi:MAG: NAD(P)H-dependent oxidoreductase [Gemmatimonadales bacterium]|nr:MAG: NAD(P)H-dependent oxidoreductase [Gemmatimonadales bacterium]